MIIMALDHVRDFFHSGAMSFQPDDLARTTAALFLTRWITHICAPVFMFTAGMGAWLSLRRGRTKAELSSFLVKRGLWLVFLDLTVLRFAMTFSLTTGLVLVSVLWALGWSMIVLAGLIHLPVRWLTVLSAAVIALHNLLDGIQAAQFGAAAWLWNVLHQLGVFPVAGAQVLVSYPLIPWFAVMSAGYCCGQIFDWDPDARRRLLLRLGSALTLAFLIIRAINLYGDPQPWTAKVPGMAILSFLRVTKYPPSLDFLLMTLGPAMLLLAWFEGKQFRFSNPLIVFGRVPLFFFAGHFLLAHLLAFPLAYFRYGTAAFVLHLLPSLGGDAKLYPPGYGYSLPAVYVIWVGVVLIMYPVCRWFAGVKKRRRDWWLGYL
ncbi:MAG: DUF1624 domain-containing protein [Bryobacterales bacterium]|nr:DUF1624 domain-containing protein [Bryobacterales bacterium]